MPGAQFPVVVGWPLAWITILYITGIIIGSHFPLPVYGIASLVVIIAITLLRKRGHMTDPMLIGIWMLIGCTRASMPQVPEDTAMYQLLHEIQDAAHEKNALFLQRLENSGLNDEPLVISAALLSGDKSRISKDTRQTFSNVGASHLLALSGLHLGILYGVLYLVLIRWVRSSEWRWFVLPPLLLLIWGYAWFACMPVSLVRAALMLSLVSVYSLSGAEMPPLHILAVSALVILIFSPEQLFNISFQLSFSATLFIICFQRSVYKMLCHKNNRMLTILSVSIVAQLGTAPLVMYYFHTFSPIAVPLSLVLIPFTTVIVYTVIAVVLFPLPFMADILDFFIHTEMCFMKWCASMPMANIDDLYIEAWHVAALYIALSCLLIRTKIIMDGGERLNR